MRRMKKDELRENLRASKAVNNGFFPDKEAVPAEAKLSLRTRFRRWIKAKWAAIRSWRRK